MSLWDALLSSSPSRLSVIARMIGPDTSHVATMTTSSEVHVRRIAPSDASQSSPPPSSASVSSHLPPRTYDALLDHLLDKSAAELADGTRIFRALVYSMAIEMGNDRVIRGLLAQGSAERSKLASHLRGTAVADRLSSASFRDTVRAVLQDSIDARAVRGGGATADGAAHGVQPQHQQQQHLAVTKAALDSIAQCDVGVGGDSLRNIACAIAMNLEFASSPSGFAPSRRKQQQQQQYEYRHSVTQIVGLPVQNCRVLPLNTAVMPLPTGAATDSYNRDAMRRFVQSSGSGKILMLVARFDFINFGALQNSSGDDDDDDESGSSDRSSDRSSSSDSDSHRHAPDQLSSDFAEVNARRDAKWARKSRSLSRIAQPFREIVHLSAAALSSTKSTATSTASSDGLEWLRHLTALCSKWAACAGLASIPSLSQSQPLPARMAIVTSQHLPDAVQRVFPPGVVIISGVDSGVLHSLERAAAPTTVRAARIPFRSDELDVRDSFIRAASVSEIQLPVVVAGATQLLFELKGVEKVNVTSSSSSSSISAAASAADEDHRGASRSAVVCGPTATITNDVKKLVLKLCRCCGGGGREGDVVVGGFGVLLELSTRCRLVQPIRDNDTVDDFASAVPFQQTLLRCCGRAALQLVASLVLSGSKSSSPFQQRTSDQLLLLRDPDRVQRLRWCFESGCWRIVEHSPSPFATPVDVFDFASTWAGIVECSLEFLALVLATDQVVFSPRNQ